MKLTKVGKVTVAILAIALVWLLASIPATMEKNSAIRKCGGKDKIEKRYTNEADVYYVCK